MPPLQRRARLPPRAGFSRESPLPAGVHAPGRIREMNRFVGLVRGWGGRDFVVWGGFVLGRWHPAELPGRVIEPQFYRSYGVPAAARPAIPNFSLPAGSRFFGARFDLMPGQHFDSFEYQILDSAGTVRAGRSLPSPGSENSEMEFAVPGASIGPGEYVLVLRGRQQGQSIEIARARFSIQR